MPTVRRLTAILAADVAGYARLMGEDEEGTHERLKAIRDELIDPAIATHHGRLVKTTGDDLLVQFSSVVDALRCAAEVQREMASRNVTVPPESRLLTRSGMGGGLIIRLVFRAAGAPQAPFNQNPQHDRYDATTDQSGQVIKWPEPEQLSSLFGPVLAVADDRPAGANDHLQRPRCCCSVTTGGEERQC
jgi:hypothetical protein